MLLITNSLPGQVGAAPSHPSWSDPVDIYDADSKHLGVRTAWEASLDWLRLSVPSSGFLQRGVNWDGQSRSPY